MTRARRPLIVIGASARAAAFSAVRAGFEPWACDLFGDMDLRAVARFVPIEREYPGGLLEAIRTLPAAPVIYTGRLEERPRLLDAIARGHELWGNGGAAARRSRDPVRSAEVYRAAGASPPEARLASDPPADRSRWLEKRAGSRRRYFQRRVEGTSASAVYVAHAGGCVLLAATRQLVGEVWLHAPRFAWCGSIGPLAVGARVTGVLRSCGEAAASAFELRGLFGIDFLLDGDVVRPVELNPRYTASVEVIEHALGVAALELHASACRGEVLRARTPGETREVLGKAVLFAPRDLVLEEDLRARHPPDPLRLPEAADLPAKGSRVRRGRPLLTVFARAASDAACEAELRRAAERAFAHFRPAGEVAE